MENTITTYNGEIARRKDCRFIKGEFYIKNKQCFLIDGVWYRINSGYIALDHELGKWSIIKGSPMVKGIISYDESNDNIVLGYFTPNNYNNVTVVVPDGREYLAINKDILKNGFYFNLHYLKFYHNSINKSSTWNKINDSYCLGNNNYRELVYNLRNISAEKIQEFTAQSMKRLSSHSPTERVARENYLPREYTYGLEFETYSGLIPDFDLSSGGFVPLRDGSIRGIEYAIIPYNSANIGNAVSLACKTLNKYVKMSTNESLHLHIGGMRNINEKFIGTLYTICCILEDEMFSMFPKYYSQTSKFKSRGKDYNKPLVKALVDKDPKITFDNISTYLSAGKKYGGFGSNHPSDPDGHHKWQIETRYHFINFINLLFGNTKTIEFRMHTPSKNPIKIMNWIYICSAIVKYAEHIANSNISLTSLKGLTLKTIINYVYSNTMFAEYLNTYVDFRKKFRLECDTKGDYIGEIEVSVDNKYIVDYN